MKTRRLLISFLALAMIVGVMVLILRRAPAEPRHNGKPLSVWFQEYTGVRPGQMGPMPPGPPFIIVSNRIIWNERKPLAPDSAWPAIAAIGSNAAPFLAAQMRHTRLDRFYERNYTNLPTLLRKRVPDPGERWLRRLRAIEIAERLGPAAHATAPALLRLLRRADPRLISVLPKALKSVRANRSDVAAVILQFGAEQKFPEVFRLVGEFGASDPGVARLLGKILAGSQTMFHRDAIRLLEASGARAAPATAEIIGALAHPDAEVRYLAARALEQIAQNIPADAQPEFERLLRRAMADKSVMVSNAARRVLLRFNSTEPLSPAAN